MSLSLFAIALIVVCATVNTARSDTLQLHEEVRFGYLASAKMKDNCASWMEGLRGDKDSTELADQVQFRMMAHEFVRCHSKTLLVVLFRCDQAAEMVFADSADTLRTRFRLNLTLLGDDPKMEVLSVPADTSLVSLRLDTRNERDVYYTSLVNFILDTPRLVETKAGSYTFPSIGGAAKVSRPYPDGSMEIVVQAEAQNGRARVIRYVVSECVARIH